MCIVDDTIAKINSIKPLYDQYNREPYWSVICPWTNTSDTADTSAVKYPQTKTCHGCDGKGWVPVSGQAQKCPVCGGSGKFVYY